MVCSATGTVPIPAVRAHEAPAQSVAFQVNPAHTGATVMVGFAPPLTRRWSVDLGGHFVRVNAYAPVARTAMAEMSPVLPPDIPDPADNAAVVTYLLSDRSDGITGQVVQRRGRRLVVLAHPRLTDHGADADTWTVDAVLERFDPVLRQHQEPVGYAIKGS